MVNQSKQFLFTQPWLALAPCIAIMIVVLAFNFWVTVCAMCWTPT